MTQFIINEMELGEDIQMAGQEKEHIIVNVAMESDNEELLNRFYAEMFNFLQDFDQKIKEDKIWD